MCLTTRVVIVKLLRKEQPMSKLVVAVKKFFGRKEEGATMIEYGLMLALIAAVCVAAVKALGTAASGMFTNITNSL
jgi:pilus assembly protein Flp/PilA